MLQVQDVHKVFFRGTPNETPALRGVSLALERGHFATVIGSNGAGKSTLFKVIAGVYPCDRGRIVLAGRDVSRDPPYRRARSIARVAQNPLEGTVGDFTVAENMALALARGRRRGAAVGVTAARSREFARQLSALGMDLESRLHTPVGLLSGGQRQALSIVMATMTQPDLLLLDEPTASLDPKAAAAVERVIADVVSRNALTALMITHHMDQALRLGSRTLIMHAGQIAADLQGARRHGLTPARLVEVFHACTGEVDDRLALSTD